MSLIRAMIVDDEELARSLLAELLAGHPDVEIIAQCSNGFEAVKAAEEHKPDLIFLDIQMPKLDGFEVLDLIAPGTPVIFVTAYDTYAMRAFEVYAVDYLLKPFSVERFNAALDRARQRLIKAISSPSALAGAARPNDHPLERLVIKDGARIHILAANQIEYIEAQDDYVAIYSAGKKYFKQQTIASLESALNPIQFIRIHRSYLANIEQITRIEPYTKDSRKAILRNGASLPVSQSGYTRLARLM